MTLPLPFPVADHTRLDRVCQDVADLMFHVGVLDKDKPNHAEIIRKITRWTDHTLRIAEIGQQWWFLRNTKAATITAGQDLIDLKGHLSSLLAVYAPRRLHPVPLQRILELRAAAQADSFPNASRECTHYAIEAGKRLHLWPAPSGSIAFKLLYLRPLHLAIVPHAWEPIIVNGVIGMYGRHVDPEILGDSSPAFEARFLAQLRKAVIEHHDTPVIRKWDDEPEGETTATANSSTGTATEVLVPASVEGVGYEMILSTGDYLLVEDGTAPFGQQDYFEVLP